MVVSIYSFECQKSLMVSIVTCQSCCRLVSFHYAFCLLCLLFLHCLLSSIPPVVDTSPSFFSSTLFFSHILYHLSLQSCYNLHLFLVFLFVNLFLVTSTLSSLPLVMYYLANVSSIYIWHIYLALTRLMFSPATLIHISNHYANQVLDVTSAAFSYQYFYLPMTYV